MKTKTTTNMKIEGVYTALITPFIKSGAVDIEGFRRNIQHQIESGIDGVLPLGTTGETPTLSEEEKEQIIAVACEEARGKVPVMVGTGSYSTKQTIENTKRAKELGADSALVVTPYYNKPTQEGIYAHFSSVADAVDLPIMLYNIPGRSGQNITPETVARLKGIPNIVSIKEASGEISQMIDIVDLTTRKDPSFTVMSGDDLLTLPLLSLGGVGVVSVISNLVPAQVVEMVQSAARGDFMKAQEIHYSLLQLMKVAFIETNPAPIKYAMNLRGMAAGGLRLPLVEMKEESQRQVREVVEESCPDLVGMS